MGGGCAPHTRSTKTETFYDLIKLEKVKFQLLCDNIIELKRAILIYHRQTIWGRNWAVRGGSFPPASPSR